MRTRIPIPRVTMTGGELPDPDVIENLDSVFMGMSALLEQHAKGLWRATALGLGMRDSGPGSYVGGITAQGNTTVELDRDVDNDKAVARLTVEIENQSPHASIVEDGHGAFHMPEKVDWSGAGGKVKIGRNGKPYLHIPFRQRAYEAPEARAEKGYTQRTIKAMMPEHIYQQAKELHRVRKLNVGPLTRLADRSTGQAKTVTGNDARLKALSLHAEDPTRWQVSHVASDRYRQPHNPRKRRLDRSDVQPMIQLGGPGADGAEGFEERRSARNVPGLGTNPAWQSSKYHGLFRAGPRGHSQYMTIRTMTPDSEGWHIPAQLGKGIVRRVEAALSHDPALAAAIDASFASWMDDMTEVDR